MMKEVGMNMYEMRSDLKRRVPAGLHAAVDTYVDEAFEHEEGITLELCTIEDRLQDFYTFITFEYTYGSIH